MGNVLILETNDQDMKFLKTLPKFSDHEFVFTNDPSDALMQIQVGNIDVFVCPYEMESFSADDILMTANMIPSRPLCILTSDASNIPGLLACLNNYSVFKMVVKPFQNVLDLKDNIDEAFEMRNKFGLKSDDMILGLIGDSKERAFWEHHDKMIDYRFLQLFSGAYTGYRIHDVLRAQEDSKEGHEKFVITMLIKNICDSLLKFTAGNANSFSEIMTDINAKYSRERSRYSAVKVDEDVYKKEGEKYELVFVLLTLLEYCKQAFTEFRSEINVKSDDECFYITHIIKIANDPVKEFDVIHKEVLYVLSRVCEKSSINKNGNTLGVSAVLKINGENL